MPTTLPASLSVGTRFAGPPGSANGGYVAGRLAALLLPQGGQAVRVTLRQPPPLEIPLLVDGSSRQLAATFGGSLIATAEPATLETPPVDPVPFETAELVMTRFAGLAAHPFPGCFVCGPDRPSPDGLGLRPGPLPDRPGAVATAWVPDASLRGPDAVVDAAFVWAALDCPGGWSTDLVGRPMVLGRMTARVDVVPDVGEPCVVVGRWVRSEGRKTFTASTAYDGEGRVLGHAESVWIQVDPTRLGTLQ